MRKFDQNAFVSCNSPPDSHLERHRVVDARSCPSSCSAESARPDSRLQFFVRMISEGNTLVIHANSDDTRGVAAPPDSVDYGDSGDGAAADIQREAAAVGAVFG
ncbi:hypothetical protein CK203_042295 [Vitis vinifera]|uniref:Uncharacterized protein n=1 Tax=Vitis vinifera TaxID=29760 RepID=A0A438H7K6_VITVI|nr:hypothetical protein CK203_042295 [Vitis vinifera]